MRYVSTNWYATKKYHPAYGTTSLYALATTFLSCGPMLLLADIAAALEGQSVLGQLFFGAMLVFCLFGAAAVLFGLMLSFLIGLFNKKTVLLSHNALTYEGKTIPLDQIRHLTVYLPEVSRTSSKPLFLAVWADNKTYMDIKRPSIALIMELKKRCSYAFFDVDDWKGHLKQCLWIQLGMVAFAIIAIIFGFE